MEHGPDGEIGVERLERRFDFDQLSLASSKRGGN
jgi:hypothetical protein